MQTSRASKKQILKGYKEKIEDLLYLNDLYINNQLNDKTYYPIYTKIHPSNRNLYPKYKYLLKDQYFREAISDNPKILEAFGNVEEIEKAIAKLHTGTSNKNLRYRASIDETLNKKDYLENYNYAEFYIKSFIACDKCNSVEEYASAANISEEEFKKCVKIVKFLNPILYLDYVAKLEDGMTKISEELDQGFKSFAEDIISYQQNGEDMPKLEFLTKTPFFQFHMDTTNLNVEYYKRTKFLCQDEEVKRVIRDYVARNGIGIVYLINPQNYINNMKAINGYEITDEDRNNIYHILESLDIVPTAYTIDQVTMNYLKNQYNIVSIRSAYEEKQKEEEIILEANPYVYTRKAN